VATEYRNTDFIAEELAHDGDPDIPPLLKIATREIHGCTQIGLLKTHKAIGARWASGERSPVAAIRKGA
jgi:hypothetical protein